MNRNVLLILIVVVVAAVAGGFILWQSRQQVSEPTEPTPYLAPPPTPTPAPTGSEVIPETTAPTEETQAVRTVTVTGTEFAFNPNEIRASAGETLEIVFVNGGSIGHNFVIPELNVGTPVIGPGEQASVTVTLPDQPTTVTFSTECTVPGHKERGMVGSIVVE